MRIARPTAPTPIPIHANTELAIVTPTPEVLRRNGARNATTYVTTTSRVLDRSSSPPCQFRASSPRRSTNSNRTHAANSSPESQFVTRTHNARSGVLWRAPLLAVLQYTSAPVVRGIRDTP